MIRLDHIDCYIFALAAFQQIHLFSHLVFQELHLKKYCRPSQMEDSLTTDGLQDRDSVDSNWFLVYDHDIMLCLEVRQHLSLNFQGKLL